MKNKKDLIYLAVIIVLAGVAAQFYYTYRYQPQRQISVYYNQDRELNKEIISRIRDADKFVYFAVYTFTRNDIKDALLAAKYRGLEVKGIMDRNQDKSTELQTKIFQELKDAGIPVYEQDHSAIMHMKVLVTEKAYASGSFNWTSAATNLNDEVLEVGTDPNVRQQYQNILEELFRRYGS
ncbi:MAG: phospholipase D-like domain-containing protein [Patescibacteria group bacterium]|nr:phospholipase D-like domain-containing protein [Patescibacteria group bacterium]